MRHDDNYRGREADASTKLTYLLIGGGIGAIVALLFAPKSGEELRGDIADATRKGVERGRETAGQLGERAGEYYEATRQRAGDFYDTSRQRASDIYETATSKASEIADAASTKVNELTEGARDTVRAKSNQVTSAIEAGKQAYQEEKQRNEPAKLPALPEGGNNGM